MAQITSREELEAWLKDKPADWAQVINMRAVLRVTPLVFSPAASDGWCRFVARSQFQAISACWAQFNIPSANTKNAAKNAARIAWEKAVRASSFALDSGNNNAGFAAAVSVIHATEPDQFNAVYAADLGVLLTAEEAWANIEFDCRWLDEDKLRWGARAITSAPMWLSGTPLHWSDNWDQATTRLLALDPSYQVWIDWYNRRIEGHDAAFDIPGDVDRVHDKAILARLADATDEDFWGKGATYVNTTLQGWIDEARIEARIDEILRKLRGGATVHYSTPEELAGRAALLDELDRLLGKPPQARHGIGGNYPPEPLDPPAQPTALPQEMREPLEAISTELEKREPDALVVVETVKLLHRAGRRLEKMAGIAGDKFAEGFGTKLGEGTAKLITRAPYLLFIMPVIYKLLDWLAPLIRIAG